MKILNFGSLNLDNVYQVPHFLQAGETMAALSEAVHPGGKGLNQSLALARAGAEVYHAGVVGNGSELLTNLLKENGVHDDYLLHRDCTQGSTMIQVSPKGENCILLFGQSNHAITKAQVEETIAAFAPGDYLVLQNEVSCLPEMVEAGAKRGLHVVLNPSPFDDSLRSLDYNQIRWIFINEVEGHQMTGETAPDAILSALRAKYPALCVVLTLGSAGSICCTPGRRRRFRGRRKWMRCCGLDLPCRMCFFEAVIVKPHTKARIAAVFCPRQSGFSIFSAKSLDSDAASWFILFTQGGNQHDDGS